MIDVLAYKIVLHNQPIYIGILVLADLTNSKPWFMITPGYLTVSDA